MPSPPGGTHKNLHAPPSPPPERSPGSRLRRTVADAGRAARARWLWRRGRLSHRPDVQHDHRPRGRDHGHRRRGQPFRRRTLRRHQFRDGFGTSRGRFRRDRSVVVPPQREPQHAGHHDRVLGLGRHRPSARRRRGRESQHTRHVHGAAPARRWWCGRHERCRSQADGRSLEASPAPVTPDGPGAERPARGLVDRSGFGTSHRVAAGLAHDRLGASDRHRARRHTHRCRSTSHTGPGASGRGRRQPDDHG